MGVMTRNGKLGKAATTSSWKMAIVALFFVLISFVALTLPDHPDAFSLGAFLRFPLEIPLTVLVLLLLPRRLASLFAAVFTLAIFTLLFLKIADIGVQSAFQRRFNPYLDMKMLFDGWNVLSGTFGKWSAGLAIVLMIVVFIALLLLFYHVQIQLIGMTGPMKRGSVIAGILLFGLGAALWAIGPLPFARADLQAIPYLGNRLALVQRSISDMRQFEHEDRKSVV